MLISNFQPSECMSMVCDSCTQPLDESNPADVRCVNINCDQIKLCHCCGEKLTSKVSSIKCYVCKEMHCLFCDKDSFRFDVRWKEKQICDHCYERNPHVDTDDLGYDYISEDEFIEIDHTFPETCLSQNCDGKLDYTHQHEFVYCLECSREYKEDELLNPDE